MNLVKNNDFDRARHYIDQGDADRTGALIAAGGNMRMSDINAALGLSQMKDIERRIANKQKVHAAFKKWCPVFETPSGPPLHNIVFTYNPDGMIKMLEHGGIEARRQYPLAPDVRGAPQQFPNAHWWEEHAVYLPFGTSLRPKQAGEIAKFVTNYDCMKLEAVA